MNLTMPSLTCFNVRFTPNWITITVTVLFVSLFLRLGFWQLARADEKQNMVAAEKKLARKETVQWTPGQRLPLQYQRLKVQGEYLTPVFLLDNQHHEHQFGYDVLSPLLLADGSVLMIDRGWLIGDNTRRTVPHIELPPGAVQAQGYTYFPSKKQWILGSNLEQKEKNTAILEKIDEKLLSQVLQKKVYPFIIRLDKGEANGFVRDWAIVSMPPERHLAYALQWFVMAIVILIIFVVLNLKKRNEK